MSTESTGFRNKIQKSVKLSTLRFASDVALRLISTVVLTRLLAPEIYGVFAVVMVYLYLLEMFSDFGIRTLILTKEGELSDDFLRTCWTVSILRGLIIAIASLGIGGVIILCQGLGIFGPDSPYSDPVLPWAIAALGGGAFIYGFETPMRFIPERNMQFGRTTFVHVATNIAGLILTVALAFYLRSVWALVLGNIARALIQLTLSRMLFPGPRMGLLLKREYLDMVIARGKWILGNSILTASSQSADRLVLGFVMSSSTFGFYFIARQLVDLVARFMTSIDNQAGLQIFTHLHSKSDTGEFRRNYYRYRLFFDAVAGLSTGALFVLAPLLVDIIFDDRYAEIAPIAQTLIWSVLLIGPLLLRSALYAEHRFREMTVLSIVSTATLWGGLGAAILVFESISMALSVIALHRLPEAMLLILRGGDRDWVIIWREFLGFCFCILGVLCGWATLQIWGLMV